MKKPLAKKVVTPKAKVKVIPTEEGFERFKDLNADETATVDKGEAMKPEENEEAGLQQFADDFMEPYLKCYPREKVFHITSDGQVFLKANKEDAAAHQKFIDKDIEVTIYSV